MSISTQPQHNVSPYHNMSQESQEVLFQQSQQSISLASRPDILAPTQNGIYEQPRQSASEQSQPDISQLSPKTIFPQYHPNNFEKSPQAI